MCPNVDRGVFPMRVPNIAAGAFAEIRMEKAVRPIIATCAVPETIKKTAAGLGPTAFTRFGSLVY